MSKLSLWLITLILFSVFTGIVFVPSVNSKKVIGSDIVTLSPIADSYVNQSSPDANYGGDTRVRIKCDDYYLIAYIMFDLSSLPPDANIIDAKLWLTLRAIGGYGDWGVTIGAHYSLDDSWNETDITWNNKPSFAPEPTDTEGFWFVFLPSTDSWNVTVDVQTAFGSDKKLTEVMIFEEPETDWGWAYFESREVGGVELEIEYTTKPIYTVEFESIQDTGNTSNLGNLNFASTIFTLPNNALVVNGSYEAEYEGGYTFLRWETEGGVNVLDPNAQKTNLTVTDSGKLRAVGSAEEVQYLYDDSGSEGYTSESAGEMVAVRFTPLFLGTLKKARFYIAELSYYPPNTFWVHVMDNELNDIISPFSQVTSSTGWFEVDLSAFNVSVHKDFYIGVEWPNDYYPCIGEDQSTPDERSFDWNGTAWEITTWRDYMIRAVVESKMPLRQIGIISSTPLSSYISGGRNVTVSGSITPIRVGVEVDVTYFRPDGSAVIRKAYTNATGEYADSFMPDRVGSWKVMASWAGDEAYEGSESYPKEFTVSKDTSSLYLSYFYPTTITIGSSINLTGDIWPERFATIDLQYSLDEGQTWITFASVNTTSNGDYSYIWTPNSIGNYKVRASWEGDEVSEGSVSVERTLTASMHAETTPPTISIFSPENKTYPAADVPLTLTVTESTSWMGYSLDGQMNVTISGNTTIVDLSDGPHTITVYANDIAGNKGSSDMVYFTIQATPIDTTPPSISIMSPENKTYDTTDILLTFTVDESVSWMAYNLDGQANTTITGDTTLSGLSDGSHSLIVYAKDTAGNTGASEIVYFTIEIQQPEPQPEPQPGEPLQLWIIVAVVMLGGGVTASLVYFLKIRKPTEKVK